MIEASEERVELATFAQSMVAGNVIEAFIPDDVSGNNPDLLCALPEHLLVRIFFKKVSINWLHNSIG